ncbi:MAG TPA: hypothetical protein PLE61_02330 [Vicinamibacterales bacterium]|nr:hypothetical protein [Vicinamibacterales bacterium]
MRRQGTPVSREALYEEVWTDAVTVVAPRCGLSGVGLLKICKKLGIPVPPRGYWAKVEAGRPTRQVPLPALPAGARSLTGPLPLSEQEAAMHARVRDALLQTRESQPSVSVPDELVDPRPLVRAAAARLKRRDGRDHPAGVRSAPKEVLDVQVTRNALDRALRLADTLLDALEPSGLTARVDEETKRRGETVLAAGVVLGSDGFGYVMDEETGAYEAFPQIGTLRLEDDVEIGANTTIDRGALGATVIGAGTKIDNLVQVAHNVRIGRHVAISAQTGIAGSSSIADRVIVGGQAGIADHVRIEEGVILGAQAGVPTSKILRGKGVVFWGSPARPLPGVLREQATLARLARKRGRE